MNKTKIIPKPILRLAFATEITRSQFLARPTHYINRLKRGESFYLKSDSGYIYFYPPSKETN
jgi:hypothetical protein